MAVLTLPGVLLSGTHASRPAANTVGNGALYAETDTGQTYQSDGVSTWTAWGAVAGGSGANADHPLPLDSYAIDATYGDDFKAASLSGSWTRRNFTGGAESYQQGPKQTYIRIATAGRSGADGYYRPAPAGDWTIATAFTIGSTGYAAHWGLSVVDSVGTGLGFAIYHGSPNAPLIQGFTTYGVCSGAYYEPIFGSSGSPNIALPVLLMQKIWLYIRKSGTNYYCAYSLDGEVWSTEGGPLSSSITVDRCAMGMVNLSSTGPATGETILVDWFNKIA